MGKINDGRSGVFSFLKKNWFIFFAILTYGFFTVYYMGPSVTSCSSVVYSFGDNTAGPIWQASLPKPQGLVGSFTDMTNAPFGDNLESPIGYSLIAQTALIRTTTGIAGPICGYNIANMMGFVLSALVMFGFIYEATKNKWVALLAGYAVSFAPYFQLKIGAHFSFGFQAIFVGVIWAFYRLLKYKKKRNAVLLGLLFALSIYWDPYFSLLAVLLIMALSGAWFVLNRRVFKVSFWQSKIDSNGAKRQFKLLVAAASIAVVLIVPLVYIFSTQGKQISTDVAASRGNVLLEAQYCSNWPHEYLVPFMHNPVFEKLFGSDRYMNTVSFMRDHYSCGIGEDVIGLSITLFVVMILGLAAILWEKLNKRKLGLRAILGFEPKILIYGLLAVAIVGVIMAFPPVIYRNIIPSPSFLLLKLTSTWRTIERIFVIINIAVVALSAVSMAYFYEHFKPNKLDKIRYVPIILMTLVSIAVITEYQTSPPFSGNQFGTFDYNNSVPGPYRWLKNQKDINTIAEYPLERSGGEGNSMAYYLSMQVIHKKKLFNGAISYSPQETMKAGLKNLSDPQTIPVLKAMGVDAVVVHGVDRLQLEKIPNISILYSGSPVGFSAVGFSPLVTNNEVSIISLKDVSPRQYILAPEKGFFRNMTYIQSATNWQYLASSGGVLKVMSLSGKPLSVAQELCFDIKTAAPAVSSMLKPRIDGVVEPDISLSASFKTVKFRAMKTIVLDINSSDGVVLTKLGCD